MRTATLFSAAVLAAAIATPAFAQGSAATTRTTAAKAAAAAKTPASTLMSYEIDAAHSELSFRIRHLLGRVRGTFGEWGGSILIDTLTPANSRVDVSIRTASIDTRNEKRDTHLRSNDFFAADSFPAITFRSTKVEKQGNAIKVYGTLTMRGKTKPVVLSGAYSGAFKDPWGKTRTAFTATTTINRQDYGVSWNSAVEAGTMLGDEVEIEIALEAVLQ